MTYLTRQKNDMFGGLIVDVFSDCLKIINLAMLQCQRLTITSVDYKLINIINLECDNVSLI